MEHKLSCMHIFYPVRRLARHMLVWTILSLLSQTRLSAQVALPPVYDTSLVVNYIRTWDPAAPGSDPVALTKLTITGVKLTTQFFDGLGNPLQTVARQMSPSKKDMVTPVVYDNMQR